jgi:N-acetylmuramoyl-L-alanine amidase
MRIHKIYAFKKKYGATNMAGFDFVNTDLPQAPFSFLQNLFWRNDIDINEPSGRQILLHELTHIRQKHTWDKLWMHIATSVCWVNPFFWLIQKELYMLHEFIADEKAIENNDGAAFAAMLLTSQYGKNIFAPAQAFAYSPIKRRLFMLTNLAKPRYSYARRLMVLPLLAVVLMLFAFRLKKEATAFKGGDTPPAFTVIIDAGHGGNDNGAVVNGFTEKDITLNIAKKIKELSPAYGVRVLLTRDGDKAATSEERINFAAGANASAFISLHVDYAATNSKAAKAESQMGMEAMVSKQNSHYSQSVLLGSALIKSLSNDFTVAGNLMQRRQPVYVLTHNPLPALLLECGWLNNSHDLTEMKSEAAVETMARKILEGIVDYASNDKQTAAVDYVMLPNGRPDTDKHAPLFVLNGKIVGKHVFDTLNANNIESVNVLKDKTATDKYGDKGAYGVVEIVTKNANGNNLPKKQLAFTETTPGKSGADSVRTTFDRSNISALKTQPLYVLDGKIIDEAQFKLIDPNRIESIGVLKGKQATDLYGAKGVNGIVQINLIVAAGGNAIGPKDATLGKTAPAIKAYGATIKIQPNGDVFFLKADSIHISNNATFKAGKTQQR